MKLTERESLIIHIYEGYKDAYGVKGRHYDFDNMTMEQLEDEADRIDVAVVEQMEVERVAEAKALRDFESEVDALMLEHAASREQAIGWILDANNLYDETDAGYICYSLGLAYDQAHLFYFRAIENLEEALMRALSK